MTTEEDATEWDVVEAKLAELKQRESARDKAVDNLYSALRAERVEHAGTKRQLDRMIQLLEDARKERDRLRGVHFDKAQLEDQIAALTKERDEARDAYTRCGVSLDALTKNLEGQIEDVSKERDRARDEVQSLNIAFGNLKYELKHTNDELEDTRKALESQTQNSRDLSFAGAKVCDAKNALKKELDAERAAHAETKKRLDAVPLSVIAANSQVASLAEEVSVTRSERDAARKELDAIKSGVDWKQLAIDEEQRHRETRKTLTEALERVRAQAASTVAERDRLRKLVKRYVAEQREMSNIRKAMFDAADD